MNAYDGQTTTASDDDKWVAARVAEMRSIGVTLTLGRAVLLPWCCDAIVNGAVYCVECGTSQREAVEKVIAKIIAARLAGLKFKDEGDGDGWA